MNKKLFRALCALLGTLLFVFAASSCASSLYNDSAIAQRNAGEKTGAAGDAGPTIDVDGVRKESFVCFYESSVDDGMVRRVGPENGQPIICAVRTLSNAETQALDEAVDRISWYSEANIDRLSYKIIGEFPGSGKTLYFTGDGLLTDLDRSGRLDRAGLDLLNSFRNSAAKVYALFSADQTGQIVSVPRYAAPGSPVQILTRPQERDVHLQVGIYGRRTNFWCQADRTEMISGDPDSDSVWAFTFTMPEDHVTVCANLIELQPVTSVEIEYTSETYHESGEFIDPTAPPTVTPVSPEDGEVFFVKADEPFSLLAAAKSMAAPG